MNEKNASRFVGVALAVGLAVLPADRAPAQGASAPEEVLVTARRREESLQEVPLAITALRSEDLQMSGVDNIEDLNHMLPNVSIAGGGTTGQASGTFHVRGIPGVARYFDGVVVSGDQGSLGNVVELERIEVLRGPQGTLFGKNAIGGAIQYVTRLPADEFGARVSATIGRFDRTDLVANVDLPLSDTLKSKITLANLRQDGFMKSLAAENLAFGSNDERLGRLDFVWTPTSGFEGRIYYEASDVVSTGEPNYTYGLGEVCSAPRPPQHNGPIPNDICLYQVAATSPDWPYPRTPLDEVAPGKWRNYQIHTNPGWDQETKRAVLDLNWSVTETLSIRSLTGVRDIAWLHYGDNDGTSFRIFEQHRYAERDELSQELQFQYASGRVSLTGGLYYFKDEETVTRARFINAELMDPDIAAYLNAWLASNGYPTRPSFGRARVDQLSASENDGRAVFVEASYDVTDRLSIAAGVRYSEETATFYTYRHELSDIPVDAPLHQNFNGTLLDTGSADFDAVSPRVSFSYHVNDDVMAYFTAAEGFGAGGFNGPNATPPNLPYDEEHLWNYELGLRSDLFDRRLRLNATYFWGEWTDIQIAEEITPLNLTTTNAGEAKIKGFELEGRFSPTDAFSLNYALGWLDTEYTDLGSAQELTLGSTFPYAPEWSYSFGVQYDLSLSSGGRLTLRADYGWLDEFVTTRDDIRQVTQDAYGLVGARVVYAPAATNWRIALWGTNLTDEMYQVGGFQIPPILLDFGTVGRPREVGLTVSMEF